MAMEHQRSHREKEWWNIVEGSESKEVFIRSVIEPRLCLRGEANTLRRAWGLSDFSVSVIKDRGLTNWIGERRLLGIFFQGYQD